MTRAWTIMSVLLMLPMGGSAQPDPSDSLRAIWSAHELPDSVRYGALEGAIRLLRSSAQDSALALAVTMEQHSMAEDRPRWTARALLLRSMILEDKLEYEQALELSLRAELIAERLRDHLLMGMALAAQAGTLGLSGQADRSIRTSMRAEQELKAAGAFNELATLRLNMAEELMILSDWERARATLQEVLANSPTPRNAMAAHLGLGKIVRRSGGPPVQALEEYRRALALVNTHGLDRYGARINIAFGHVYLTLGRFDSASHHFRDAIEQAGARGLRQDELSARLGLAESDLGNHRPQAALSELDTVRQGLGDAQAGHLLKELYRLYSSAYKAIGDPARALRSKELMDSVITELDMLERQRVMQQWAMRNRLEDDSVRVAGEKQALAEKAQAAVRRERDRKRFALGGAACIMILAVVLWRMLRHTRREKARSEEILHEMLPEEIARELKETGAARTRQLDHVSVLFTDFEGFTELTARTSQEELVTEIDACFRMFDELCHRHDLERIKTIGDAYMAAAGLRDPTKGTATGSIRCALDMQAFIEARHTERSAKGLPAFRMRAGIHTGPVVAGIVGVKKFQYDIWGDTVNTASRMESSGEVGEVNISEATYALVKDEPDFTFTPRGKVQAKGKGGLEMYFVRRTLA